MAGKYVSFSTREKLERPVAEMQEIKDNSYVYAQVPKKQEFEDNFAKRKKVLEAVTPPETTESEKEVLQKRVAALSEALINGNAKYVPPMPNDQQMQRAPVGAVDQHMRWESFWKRHNIDAQGNIYRIDKNGRGAVFEWKDLRRMIARGYESEAPNFANVEMIRPNGTVDLASTRLPVSYGLSIAAKAHYDEVFPDHEPTAVEKKLQASETDELKERIAQLEAALKIKKSKQKGRDLSDYDGPRCPATKKDGSMCGQPCLPGKNHCFAKTHKKQMDERAAAEASPVESITEEHAPAALAG